MMAERRPLLDGIKTAAPPIDPQLEKAFVFGDKEPQAKPVNGEGRSVARAPITTRIRSDFAAALKQASLKRQLEGTTPNTLQAILEEAVEPWLKNHGYLP